MRIHKTLHFRSHFFPEFFHLLLIFFHKIFNLLFLVFRDVWNTFQHSYSRCHRHPSNAIHWHSAHTSHHSETHISLHTLHWRMSHKMPSVPHPAMSHSHSDHSSGIIHIPPVVPCSMA